MIEERKGGLARRDEPSSLERTSTPSETDSDQKLGALILELALSRRVQRILRGDRGHFMGEETPIDEEGSVITPSRMGELATAALEEILKPRDPKWREVMEKVFRPGEPLGEFIDQMLEAGLFGGLPRTVKGVEDTKLLKGSQ